MATTYTVKFSTLDPRLSDRVPFANHTWSAVGRREAKELVSRMVRHAKVYVNSGFFAHLLVKDDKGNVIGRWLDGAWL